MGRASAPAGLAAQPSANSRSFFPASQMRRLRAGKSPMSAPHYVAKLQHSTEFAERMRKWLDPFSEGSKELRKEFAVCAGDMCAGRTISGGGP